MLIMSTLLVGATFLGSGYLGSYGRGGVLPFAEEVLQLRKTHSLSLLRVQHLIKHETPENLITKSDLQVFVEQLAHFIILENVIALLVPPFHEVY